MLPLVSKTRPIDIGASSLENSLIDCSTLSSNRRKWSFSRPVTNRFRGSVTVTLIKTSVLLIRISTDRESAGFLGFVSSRVANFTTSSSLARAESDQGPAARRHKQAIGTQYQPVVRRRDRTLGDNMRDKRSVRIQLIAFCLDHNIETIELNPILAPNVLGLTLLPLNTSGPALSKRLHLVQSGHGGVTGKRRKQGSMGPTKLYCFLFRRPCKQAVKEARGVTIATAHPVIHVQFGCGRLERFAVDPGDCAPAVAIGRVHFAESGCDDFHLWVFRSHAVHHAEESTGIELGFGSHFGSWD